MSIFSSIGHAISHAAHAVEHIGKQVGSATASAAKATVKGVTTAANATAKGVTTAANATAKGVTTAANATAKGTVAAANESKKIGEGIGNAVKHGGPTAAIALLIEQIDKLASKIQGYEAQLAALDSESQELKDEIANLSKVIQTIRKWLIVMQNLPQEFSKISETFDSIESDLQDTVNDLEQADITSPWLIQQLESMDSNVTLVKKLVNAEL